MTSREIVKRCIEFRNPPRIGLHFVTDSIDGKIWDESDFAYSGYATDPRFIPAAGQKEWVTEWGVKRSTINTSVGDWPAEYSVHIMPHDGDDYQIKLPNIADGHGGGDYKIFDALFKGTLKDGDPLGIYASAIDGVSSMIIGAAANQSALSGQPVAMKNILGAHAEQW